MIDRGLPPGDLGGRKNPMKTACHSAPVEKPTDGRWEVSGGGIQHGSPEGFQQLCLALYDAEGKVVGELKDFPPVTPVIT